MKWFHCDHICITTNQHYVLLAFNSQTFCHFWSDNHAELSWFCVFVVLGFNHVMKINDKYESLTTLCKSAPITLGFEIHALSKIGIDINLKVCRSLRLNPYVCQITIKPWFSKFRLAKRLENDILLSHFKSS